MLATAITPSGPIHVGNLREILTTEAIYRALKERGVDAELLYIGDTFDPLRKVYPFLPPSYEKYIGMPLSDIPCPCGAHENYAAHFLEPFFESLKEIGIRPRKEYAHEMYRSGRYNEAIKLALDNAETIREIMKRVAKRELPSSWMPFNVKCSSCGRLDGEITSYEYPIARYACRSCGNEGEVNLTAGGVGKLPWRVDWPARWHMLGVTFEAFGKDHAAAGSSWDTGKEIVKEVYHHEPPMPLVYEFIQLKGKGAMHSSTGTAISAEEILRMTPPEVLRFLLMKYEPSRHIDFDSGLGLLDLVDEYDRYERVYFGIEEEGVGMKEPKRVYELSQPYPERMPPTPPVQIPYRHLVTLIQIAGDWEGVLRILKRNGEIETLSAYEEEKLKERVEKVRYWLEHFAPENVKFSVQKQPPKIALADEQKKLLAALRDALESTKWKPEDIHNTIHTVAAEQGEVMGRNVTKELFTLIYRMFLGKERGPRAGYFLHSLEKSFVLKRIAEFT